VFAKLVTTNVFLGLQTFHLARAPRNVYPSHFNCAWEIRHAQSRRVKTEKEQSKHDYAEMEQK